MLPSPVPDVLDCCHQGTLVWKTLSEPAKRAPCGMEELEYRFRSWVAGRSGLVIRRWRNLKRLDISGGKLERGLAYRQQEMSQPLQLIPCAEHQTQFSGGTSGSQYLDNYLLLRRKKKVHAHHIVLFLQLKSGHQV